jgi:hypothetical protein
MPAKPASSLYADYAAIEKNYDGTINERRFVPIDPLVAGDRPVEND